MLSNSWTVMGRLLAERYDTKSNVKIDGFRSQLQASYMSSHTEELWYYETICLVDNNILLPTLGVEHSGEGINRSHSRNAKLFVWIKYSGIC